MTKTQLENLIKRMNAPYEPEIKVSWENESWKARREAEKLSDTALLPVLEQIIDEHRGESDGERELRRDARFIYAKILSNNFDEKGFLFLLNELFTETDYWTIESILTNIWFLDIQQDTKLSPLLNFAENANRENLQTVLNILIEYKKKGNKDAIRVVSATEPVSDDEGGEIYEMFLEWNDEKYSERLSKRVRDGLDTSVKNGTYCGGYLIYGYKLIDTDKKGNDLAK